MQHCYFSRVRDHKRLTWEQERALIILAQTGDKDALETLVMNNQGLIIKQARRYLYLPRDHDIDDLIQAGNLGMLHAIRKFDVTRGLRFSTYVTWWVRKSIRDEGLKNKSILYIPAGIIENMDALRRKRCGGRSAFKMSHRELKTAKELNAVRYVSLQDTFDENKKDDYADVIGEPVDYERDIDLGIAVDRIKNLSGISRKVLMMYLDGFTREEILKSMNLTLDKYRGTLKKAIQCIATGG